MSDLTAIDITLNPDEIAIAHTKGANAKLRQNFPGGFELVPTNRFREVPSSMYATTASGTEYRPNRTGTPAIPAYAIDSGTISAHTTKTAIKSGPTQWAR
jgi:hypothetical protein